MRQLLKRIVCSSLGKKYIMAVSGCLLFLFVVAHLPPRQRARDLRARESLVG